LKVRAEEFSSEALGIDSVSRGAFTWRDNLGLESSAPWNLTIETQKDAPPVPELPDMPREVAILETEVLNIKMAARDDFGVRDFGLSFEPGSELRQAGNISQDEFKDQAATPRQKKLETVFQFSPALLKVPADSAVEFHAYATDFFPDRQPAESAVYRIYVVDNARHAELVRQKLESLLIQLEEVTRLEEKIANA